MFRCIYTQEQLGLQVALSLTAKLSCVLPLVAAVSLKLPH